MNRLKELRQKRGLLQSDIAKIIEKSDRAVGQYERGERDPSSETWIKLANFNCTTILSLDRWEAVWYVNKAS